MNSSPNNLSRLEKTQEQLQGQGIVPPACLLEISMDMIKRNISNDDVLKEYGFGNIDIPTSILPDFFETHDHHTHYQLTLAGKCFFMRILLGFYAQTLSQRQEQAKQKKDANKIDTLKYDIDGPRWERRESSDRGHTYISILREIEGILKQLIETDTASVEKIIGGSTLNVEKESENKEVKQEMQMLRTFLEKYRTLLNAFTVKNNTGRVDSGAN